MEWFKVFFGYRYLVNMHTGEVHNLRNPHKNCQTFLIGKDHKKYVTLAKAKKMIATGKFNGCRWCMGAWDTDSW
jgi:hypothetical protein